MTNACHCLFDHDPLRDRTHAILRTTAREWGLVVSLRRCRPDPVSRAPVAGPPRSRQAPRRSASPAS